MSKREMSPTAVQSTLIAAMAIWGLNVAAVKVLTGSFDPTMLAQQLSSAHGWRPWAFILFSGVLATALSNLLWCQAIARIGVARTAVFLYWVPVFGVAFAAVLLGERLTLWHLFGFLAVMGGTYLGKRQSTTAASVTP
ncbi:MAG TPA: DMT family transporter [Variovorax sp.]|nr:DMT family transporter [Variovorax sp.]